MSKATIEQMKEEAVRRMRLLHMHPNVEADFLDGIINYSVEGILFWQSSEQMERIQAFEQQTGNLVYHVLDGYYLDIGRLLTLLYVTPDKNEWPRERKDLIAGEIFTYVINVDCEYFSEYGIVGIEPFVGGLRRTF